MISKESNQSATAEPVPIRLENEDDKENQSAQVPLLEKKPLLSLEENDEQVDASVVAQAERIAEETLVL